MKIIIDTDPGIDDGLAIMLALACPEFDILGLTTIFGNVPVELATENALRLLDLAGRSDIPVSQGAAKSWETPYGGAKSAVHGEDGQGNLFSPTSAQKPLETTAAEFIVSQISKFPNEVTLIALGPLTNLADALKHDPEIQHKVKEVLFMGGNAFCAGNTNPVAEANILADPEAADFVLGHHWPMTMVGLDVTQKTYIPSKLIAELAVIPSAIGNQVFGAYRHYLKFYKEVNQMDGTWIHDSSVFTYLLNKELYRTSEYPILVETADCISRGKTWPSIKDYSFIAGQENPWLGRPKVNICDDVNGKKAVSLLKNRLMNATFPIEK
ncbi:MAG: nucleoside hydrolase [Flavobacteriaceae bacterium]